MPGLYEELGFTMASTSIGNILLDKEILLESGTNELEVLVFRLEEFTFGINVAKVREVLPTQRITSLPKAHPSILGVFKLRDTVVPCVSLRKHLGVAPPDPDAETTLILADFNGQQTAFQVDTVERIHRLSWEQVLAMPSLEALADTPVTAVSRLDDRLVIMLDFEMISDQVTEQFYRTAQVENPTGLPRRELRILLAEDSPTVREAVCNTLQASGYTNLTVFDNGAQAWQWIDDKFRETGDVKQVADLLISDVEMPQIDGFHLTRKMKEHPQLQEVPVLLYSSIVTPDNQKKGAAVGAEMQVAKPDLHRVVELADGLISASDRCSPSPEPPTEASPPGPQEPPADRGTSRDEEPPASPENNGAPLGGEALRQEPAREPADDAGELPEHLPAGLWLTFREELRDRCRRLRAICDRVVAGRQSEQDFNDAFRTLHSIKSAAMVVPVDEVTRVTHLVESSMESARQDPGSDWPAEALARYVEWIGDVSDPSGSAATALAAGVVLEAELLATC